MLESLYRRIAEEWRRLQELREATRETLDRLRVLLGQALAFGVSGRCVARRTDVPETTVRRLTAARPQR